MGFFTVTAEWPRAIGVNAQTESQVSVIEKQKGEFTMATITYQKRGNVVSETVPFEQLREFKQILKMMS